MLKRSILGAFGVVIFTVSLWSAETAQVIAVIDFTHNDTSALEASTASDYFRTGLINAAGFSVINKSEIEAAAKEYNLNLADSSDQNTFIKFAEHLKADIIVTGSLTKLNEVYFISANAVNVKTNRFICSKNAKCTQSTDLPSVSEKLANEVALAIAESQKSSKRNIESSYKKYAVYLMGATPEMYLGANSYSIAFGGYNFNFSNEDIKGNATIAGAGIKIYPSERLFFDVYLLGPIQISGNGVLSVKNSNYNQTLTYKLDFLKKESVGVSVNYLLFNVNAIKFSLGAGYLRSALDTRFRLVGLYELLDNTKKINIGNSIANNDAEMINYNATVEWKPSTSFSLSAIFQSIYSEMPAQTIYNRVTISDSSTLGSITDSSINTYSIKKNEIAIKFLASYYFNLEL